MQNKNNPLLRFIKNGRLTAEEKFEAMTALMDDYSEQDDPLKLEVRNKLIHHSERIEAAKKLVSGVDEINGLRTDFKHIDEMTGGINPSEIVVLFADTGIGKSQLAQNITLNIAYRGEPVLFIGLEMDNDENEARFLQMYSPDTEGFEELPILYPTTNDLTYKDIDGLVEKAKGEGAVLVVVDHLHMFDTGNSNRADGIEDICREFKRVTRKHKMPMLLLSHTNRSEGARGVPDLRHLKGSSAIEQIADIAITLWKDPSADDPSNTPLFVKVRKQRKRWRRRDCKLTPTEGGRLAEDLDLDLFPTLG